MSRNETEATLTMQPIFLAPTTLPHSAPLDYIDAAKSGGYDGVGLRVHPSPGLPYAPLTGDRALEQAVRARLDATGLPVLDLYSFYLRPDTDVTTFRPALEYGASLGARYAVVMGDDPDWARLTDNCARICESAAGLGLVCTLEYAVIRPLATLAQTVRLIAAVGAPNLVACLDPLNHYRAQGTAAEVRALPGRLFPYAQISDGVRSPDDATAELGRFSPNQRRMLGAGDVPVAELLHALPAGIPLSVELPQLPGRACDAPTWARMTADNVRDWLARHPRPGA